MRQLTGRQEEVRQYLLTVAEQERTVTYGHVAARFGYATPRDNALFTDLGEVSLYELECRRPMLSAVVVNQSKSKAGGGFPTLCGLMTDELRNRLASRLGMDVTLFQRMEPDAPMAERHYNTFWKACLDEVFKWHALRDPNQPMREHLDSLRITLERRIGELEQRVAALAANLEEPTARPMHH